jgi:hypothetical protein
MDHRSRFIFSGHAAAYGGRIVRPKDITVETSATCALTASGGRGDGRAGSAKFETFVSVGQAAASAQGNFEDTGQYELSTWGKLPRNALTAKTHVRTELAALIVGDPALGQPQLHVERIAGGLTAYSARASRQPRLRFDPDTVFGAITIDNYRLVVTLNLELFNEYDTEAKLMTAADDPRFVEQFGSHLFLHRVERGVAPPAYGRLLYGGEAICGTIVRSIDWDGPPFPGSSIDINAVEIPELGRLYFGELLITRSSRRVTMLRLELGSPMGGDMSCCDYQDNGGWSP